MDFMGFIKSHPIAVGVGVFVVGAFVLLGRGGSSQGDGGAGAFYAAQAASKTSGDNVMIAQIAANSADKQALAYFDAQQNINTTWAGTQVTLANANNSTALALAPYQVESNYLDAVTSLAMQPQQTVTSTSKKSGIFGIGGSKKTTTTVVPNPGWDLLANYNSVFHAAHG